MLYEAGTLPLPPQPAPLKGMAYNNSTSSHVLAPAAGNAAPFRPGAKGFKNTRVNCPEIVQKFTENKHQY